MSIVVIGMNHRTAPLRLREQLALHAADLTSALCARHQPETMPRAECVVLSTCNRFEYYMVVSCPEKALDAFVQAVQDREPLAEVDIRPHLYCYADARAARHLFRVASGLDSMVLGEPQILGQVARAYEDAQAAGLVGPLLSRLFQKAIRVGKRARAETDIGRAHASVGSAAVHLLRREVPDFSRARALVVGAGKMARIAARYLRSGGVARLAIVNRTRSRAEAVAAEVGATVYPWEDLKRALDASNVVIVATGAPTYVILPEHVENRAVGLDLVVVDIAVPRNVHPGVGSVPGVRVFDIDDLEGIVDEGIALRRRAIPQVERIIENAVEEYMQWLQARAVTPTISALYEKAERIRRQTLNQTLRRVSDEDPAPQVLEEVTRILVEKLLQVPARNLHLLAREGRANGYDQALKELFELNV